MPQDKKLTETKITVLNNQINQLVYQLYELNEEEVGVVEGVYANLKAWEVAGVSVWWELGRG